MDPMNPPTDKPAEGGAAPSPKEVADLIGTAESDGKLKALEDLMVEQGWDEDPGALIILAQKDDRTAGKSPDELAEMMRSDPSLYDDLVAYKPGGALEGLAKKGPEVEVEVEVTPEGESAGEDEPSDEEVGGFLGQSASMKDADAGKAKGAMKAAGFKPGRDDNNLDKKRKMMEQMGD